MLPHSDMTSKKSRFLSAIQLFFLILFAVSILRAPADACSFAALALKLWFEKMIPSLFPFMVLSGLIVRLGSGRTISLPVSPVLGRLYRMDRTMCTTLLLGFLFGFPLGAKTIAEQYSLRQLTKPQAQYLLSFCNNIGPVYLLSFALPLLGLSEDAENRLLKTVVISAFFGLPLLYGLLLRHTVYRRFSFSSENPPARAIVKPESGSALPNPGASASITAASSQKSGVCHFPASVFRLKTRCSVHMPFSPCLKVKRSAPRSPFSCPESNFSSPLGAASIESSRPSFLSALDASVTSACSAIARLGGYMVFFIVCNLPVRQILCLFHTAFPMISQDIPQAFPDRLASIAAPTLEITSGLSLAAGILPPALSMVMLTFGGLSCFAQTYTCIRETDLSFKDYCLHKLLQSAIAFCLYTLLFSAFSASAAISPLR